MQEKSKPVDNLRADAEKIITRAIAAVLPDAAVERALKGKTFLGRVYTPRGQSDDAPGFCIPGKDTLSGS